MRHIVDLLIDQIASAHVVVINMTEERPKIVHRIEGQVPSNQVLIFRSRRPLHPQRQSDAVNTSLDDGIFTGVCLARDWFGSRLRMRELIDLEFVEDANFWERLYAPLPPAELQQ